ncbi:cellulose synthase-like protein G2 [Impatiens glandulifera]|uniref:cellulose synthase-like protein G2 n=1 Tax=Impatiens glandulifera TaxID=253017 RepID=UPI001FB199B8|nr:cellulose synthase-like protein G2 [Impatiens glandulifera]
MGSDELPPSPLHHFTVKTSIAIINRVHAFVHLIAIISFIYYRISSFSLLNYPIFLWILILVSELLLSFLWLLCQAFGWRPVYRSVFPERLPPDADLPPIDVFICTADPEKEPAVGVMNTVLSVMAIDYPPEKLSVYLSDDAGSQLTLNAVREAWDFAKSWVPFFRRHGLKVTSPEAYFSGFGSDRDEGEGRFLEEEGEIERKYKLFEERLMKNISTENEVPKEANHDSQNHPSLIQVIGRNEESPNLPRLVYVCREKNSSYFHNFKAGALNVLLRVSAIISNAPYILVLDCDMYSNDHSSARQAMCFHLDPLISESLAFVQFPQKFHNVSDKDIYDSAMRSLFTVKWMGMDGLQGPIVSGTCLYIKRMALYGIHIPKDDISRLRESFGTSDEFLKSIDRVSSTNHDMLQHETAILASCTYERQTEWGERVGYKYGSLVEDFYTSLVLHSNGWNSVFCNPERPAFLGSCTTNLSDCLIQCTRWYCGLLEVGVSTLFRYIFGPASKISFLQAMCYAYLSFQPLYFFPLWCLATIPQLCLLNGINIYPKVTSPWFMVLCFVFLSVVFRHMFDVLATNGTIRTWEGEWRMWFVKSVTASFYGSMDVIMKLLGLKKTSFLTTNKVAESEQVRLYQIGKIDFNVSRALIVPVATLVVINAIAFALGGLKVVVEGRLDEMFGQIFLSLCILLVNYPLIEGILFRKDKGRVAISVTILSLVFAVVFLCFGSVCFILMYY